MGHKQLIQLVSNNKISTGEVEVSTPEFSARLGKALVIGMAMLFATGLSVLIPMLHFVLVPLLLLVTVVVVASILKASEFIDSGSGVCPACGAEFNIRRRRLSFPFADVCGQCGRSVRVQAAE